MFSVSSKELSKELFHSHSDRQNETRSWLTAQQLERNLTD